MASSWLKLVVPALLLLSFVSHTRTKKFLEIGCPDSPALNKNCPEYCPKDSRPEKVNPNSAWAVACVCCNVPENGINLRSGLPSVKNKTHFKIPMQPKPVKPEEVSKEDRQRLLDLLESLRKANKLPYKEFEWWKVKIDDTQKHLLTRDEEELLVQLLVDCAIPWNNAILYVHPLAGDQALPKPKNIAVGMRSSFGSKFFSYDDLKEHLKSLQVKEKKAPL